MAGGDTQVGGNGSVYWKATHYDSSQKKRQLKTKTKGDVPHASDEIYITNDEVLGRDGETAVTDVGARLGHRGYFLVTLRYRTMQEAEEAGSWVAQNVRPARGGYYLTVRVPVINRDSPKEDPPFEVKVEW